MVMSPQGVLLHGVRVVFWDFDGVIKDSVKAKSVAFEQLFAPYGQEVAEQVRRHHEAHGGVSRFDKIPMYLGWAGEAATEEKVREFCDRFSRLAGQAVIDSAWVPGIREYLEAHHACQTFVLVSATPQQEIEQILRALNLFHCFSDVYGVPTAKSVAIQRVLQRLECPPEQALMVGDSDTDLNAAKANHVAFLLRRTAFNRPLQKQYSGPAFDNLEHE